MTTLPPRLDDLSWLNSIADDGRPRREMPLPAGEEASFAGVSHPTHPSVRERRALAIRCEEAIFEGRWEAFVRDERVLSWTQRLGFAPDRYDWRPVRERVARAGSPSRARRVVSEPDPLLIRIWHSKAMTDVWDSVLGGER